MCTYEVKMIVEGRTTVVRVQANNGGDARVFALAQYSGSNAHVIETRQVKN
jgi:hypothetical protein